MLYRMMPANLVSNIEISRVRRRNELDRKRARIVPRTSTPFATNPLFRFSYSSHLRLSLSGNLKLQGIARVRF